MTIEIELGLFSKLVSEIRFLRRSGRSGSKQELEAIDELEVLEMHADSRTVKASCAKALRSFRALAPGPTQAHG